MHDIHVHILTAASVRINRYWDAKDVCSTFWRLYVNNRDGAAVRLKTSLYPITARRIHIIPAYTHFSCVNEQPLEHFYIHFDVLGVSPLLQRRLFPVPFSCPEDKYSKELVLGCHEQGADHLQPLQMSLAHSVIHRVLWQAISDLSPTEAKALNEHVSPGNPLHPALRLLESRLPLSVGVEELAEACGFSSDHFSRLFRQHVGQSPGRYILERRLSMAARALLYDQASIDSVALQHAFANRFHFSRAFKGWMGVSPAKYRSRARV